MKQFDYLVLGSGIAGLTFALKVAPRALALPWHRVLTASGRPAFPPGTVAYQQQCRRLQREGVRFVNGRVVRATATSRAALDALLWDVAR